MNGRSFLKKKRTEDKKLLKLIATKPCLICGLIGVDAHHLITRGSGGPDKDWNLVPLCRKHHVEIHSIGMTKFGEEHHIFELFLKAHDWHYNEWSKKWEFQDSLEL